ncbi:arsenic resistance protein [Microbacterium sp. GXF6406]
MTSFAARAERGQVPIYLVTIAVAAVIGVMVPSASHATVAVEPILALLLFATFLGVPLTDLVAAFGDRRFLGAVAATNFVVVPVVAYVLSRFVADDPALVFGVLLVLLAPCVDYVIVFTRLAGGSADRLLALTPVLMIAQLLALPGYLWLFLGEDAVAAIDPAPFVRAFVLLIVLPLAAAALTQALAHRHSIAAAVRDGMLAAMVPLLAATLAVVVAAHAGAVGGSVSRLAVVVPVFAVFIVIMVVAGVGVGRMLRVDDAGTRAVIFSGTTRNSLVVLPLATALPAPLALTPLVVITQTFVELIGMVVLVRLVPRLARGRRER